MNVSDPQSNQKTEIVNPSQASVTMTLQEFFDITGSRERAEKELKESSERLEGSEKNSKFLRCFITGVVEALGGYSGPGETCEMAISRMRRALEVLKKTSGTVRQELEVLKKTLDCANASRDSYRRELIRQLDKVEAVREALNK